MHPPSLHLTTPNERLEEFGSTLERAKRREHEDDIFAKDAAAKRHLHDNRIQRPAGMSTAEHRRQVRQYLMLTNPAQSGSDAESSGSENSGKESPLVSSPIPNPPIQWSLEDEGDLAVGSSKTAEEAYAGPEQKSTQEDEEKLWDHFEGNGSELLEMAELPVDAEAQDVKKTNSSGEDDALWSYFPDSLPLDMMEESQG